MRRHLGIMRSASSHHQGGIEVVFFPMTVSKDSLVDHVQGITTQLILFPQGVPHSRGVTRSHDAVLDRWVVESLAINTSMLGPIFGTPRGEAS